MECSPIIFWSRMISDRAANGKTMVWHKHGLSSHLTQLPAGQSMLEQHSNSNLGKSKPTSLYVVISNECDTLLLDRFKRTMSY